MVRSCGLLEGEGKSSRHRPWGTRVGLLTCLCQVGVQASVEPGQQSSGPQPETYRRLSQSQARPRPFLGKDEVRAPREALRLLYCLATPFSHSRESSLRTDAYFSSSLLLGGDRKIDLPDDHPRTSSLRPCEHTPTSKDSGVPAFNAQTTP